jgi:hypothetical protein
MNFLLSLCLMNFDAYAQQGRRGQGQQGGGRPGQGQGGGGVVRGQERTVVARTNIQSYSNGQLDEIEIAALMQRQEGVALRGMAINKVKIRVERMGPRAEVILKAGNDYIVGDGRLNRNDINVFTFNLEQELAAGRRGSENVLGEDFQGLKLLLKGNVSVIAIVVEYEEARSDARVLIERDVRLSYGRGAERQSLQQIMRVRRNPIIKELIIDFGRYGRRGPSRGGQVTGLLNITAARIGRIQTLSSSQGGVTTVRMPRGIYLSDIFLAARGDVDIDSIEAVVGY